MKERDRIAPAGAIWVCGACGKTARDRYGIEGEHDRGWDESCMLNAVLCAEASLVRGDDGCVVSAEAVEKERAADNSALGED